MVTSLRCIPTRLFTLICTSTTSPATTVVWTKDGTTLSFDGTAYQHSQVVTNRRTSTYDNILTSTGTPASTFGSYTCTVSNILGASREHLVIRGNAAQFFSRKVVQDLIVCMYHFELQLYEGWEVKWTNPKSYTGNSLKWTKLKYKTCIPLCIWPKLWNLRISAAPAPHFNPLYPDFQAQKWGDISQP